MPTTEIKLDYGDEALDRVVDMWYREEHLGMAHKATFNLGQPLLSRVRYAISWRYRDTHLVIRSSMLRGSRMKVGKTTLLRSAPGRSWDMMWVRTAFRLVPSNTVFIFIFRSANLENH